MTFTQKFLEFDFSLATGNFQGGGNSYTATGLRSHATIVKAGGVSQGAASIDVYGLPLSMMNQLCTYGQTLTLTGRNSITVKAGETGSAMTIVFTGTIQSAPVRYCWRMGESKGSRSGFPIRRRGIDPVSWTVSGLVRVGWS